jgi:hypothetical protein
MLVIVSSATLNTLSLQLEFVRWPSKNPTQKVATIKGTKEEDLGGFMESGKLFLSRFVPQDEESERDIDLLYTECTVQRWNCISNEIDG